MMVSLTELFPSVCKEIFAKSADKNLKNKLLNFVLDKKMSS